MGLAMTAGLRKVVTMRQALADPTIFRKLVTGPSWRPWRVLLIAIMGEKLTPQERGIFEQLTGRGHEPGEVVHEFWARSADVAARAAPPPFWRLIWPAVSITGMC